MCAWWDGWGVVIGQAGGVSREQVLWPDGDIGGSDQIWLQWWQQGEEGRIRALYLRLGDWM